MLKTYNNYLQKQSLHPALIESIACSNLQSIVTIPAYNEPDILQSIESICSGTSPLSNTEIIVLFNHKEDTPQAIKDQNKESYKQVNNYKSPNGKIQVHAILIGNLPQKHAGVGLARKILMDEAIQRFNSINQDHGIIISLDADTLVSSNYLSCIEKSFGDFKKINCTIFNFEHRINPDSYGKENSQAITLYELYLRYYKLALHKTGFPYAFHTIGSCFAVSAEAYVKQGGMNKKQAGEDFYFLQKIFPLEKTKEVKQVWVYPSARPSNRVPFGTGPAIRKIAVENKLLCYQWSAFLILETLFLNFNILYKATTENSSAYYQKQHVFFKNFMDQKEWLENLEEINNNSSNTKTFKKRFFQWFNAFKIIKFLNHTHRNDLIKTPVEKACLEYLGIGTKPDHTELLKIFRALEN